MKTCFEINIQNKMWCFDSAVGGEGGYREQNFSFSLVHDCSFCLFVSDTVFSPNSPGKYQLYDPVRD